ncbi:MAG: diaminopimelate decarboxylase, partial [Planctomycetota bacterium]
MKASPIEAERLCAVAREHGTPLYVYDAATIRARVGQLAAFDVVRYAQKANSNLAILRLIRSLGAKVDAVSTGEILRAMSAGFAADEIAYTADVFDDEARKSVAELALRVNCGSLDMLPAFASARSESSLGKEVTLRVNAGFGHGHDARVATGGESSKHGIWHADLPRAIEMARDLGLSITGLHVHVGSGSDLENLMRATSTFEAAATRLSATLRSLSAGGGLPIPYRDGESDFDVRAYFEAWDAARTRIGELVGRRLELEVEPGRFLVAESGVLLTSVLGTKRNGEIDYALVDAGFHTLLRPAMYSAYHRIEALTASGPGKPTMVAGPLCESGDVFTRTKSGELDPRQLPVLSRGDL